MIARTVFVSLGDIVKGILKITYNFVLMSFCIKDVSNNYNFGGGINKENIRLSQRLMLNLKVWREREAIFLLTSKESAKNSAKLSWPSGWYQLWKKIPPILLLHTSETGWLWRNRTVFLKYKENAWKLTNGFLFNKTIPGKDRNSLLWVHLSEVVF